MKSDGEYAQPDSSSNCSSPLRKSKKTNADASPSPSTSISSLGSTASYAIPRGSPGLHNRYKRSSRDNPRRPQELDFGQPLGVALNNNSGTAGSYDHLSIEELLKMNQQIQESIKKKQSIQTQTNLQDTLRCESQDDKYSESQDSNKPYDIDFFNKTNTELDEEITQEEEYSQGLDDEITKITDATTNIDTMSVDELEKLSEDALTQMLNTLLKKQEYEELRNIFEIQQTKAKNEAKKDKEQLNIKDENYNKACSQSDNEDSQMTSNTCESTATMMEDTIKEIHKNNVIRKIEHKNRQDTVKTILDARYNKEINFDNIRAAVEEGKSTNEQMSRIWGNYIEGETFNDKHCCYLCGGKLVNIKQGIMTPGDSSSYHKGLKPEIEHKLPAIEFYSKVHNIINREEYKNLFEEWQIFINTTDSSELLQVYNSINCNETKGGEMNSKLDELCNIFKQDKEEDKYIEKFICLIKINLIEFAYSHHTCNQVKSNNNLRKTANKYTESIEDYLSNLRNVINKNNINMKDQQQIIGLIKDYKLQHEKKNILDSIANPNNTERIESNMRLINSLIDDYTRLCDKTPTRMIAESIRDMKKKITNKTKGKEISAQKKRIQDQIKLTPNQVNSIIKEFESVITQIDGTQNSRKSPRSANDPKTKFINLYIEKEIENKNGLIKRFNEIEPSTYKNFDKYVKYYRDNIQSNFPDMPFARPKSANGGKKSRRLRLKSNRKTKKRCKKSKK